MVTELQAVTAPDLPPQQPLVDASNAKDIDKTASIPSGIQSAYGTDETMWYRWLWSPPSGSCTPFTGSVHGWCTSIDVCSSVAQVRDVLGFLFALFGAWEIYAVMFRRVG